MSDKTKLILKVVLAVIIAAATAAASALGLQSCSMTRVVTNESSSYHRGDTAVTITTRTIETYNATKSGTK